MVQEIEGMVAELEAEAERLENMARALRHRVRLVGQALEAHATAAATATQGVAHDPPVEIKASVR